MEHGIERSPRGQIEEPGEIALEQRGPGLWEQEKRKDHREHRVENDCEDQVQHRHPGHRLARGGDIGILRLHIGMERGKGVAAARAEVGPGPHEGIDQRALLKNLLRAHRVPTKVGLRHRRQVGLQLGDGGGCRQVGVEGWRCRLQTSGSKIGVSRLDRSIGGLTADDRGRAAACRDPAGRTRRRTRAQCGQQVCAARQGGPTAPLAQQDVIEGALLEVGFDIGLHDRIGDRELAGQVVEPCRIEHPARSVLEAGRHREHALGGLRQPVVYLA